MHRKIWACIAAIFLLALRCAPQTPAAVPITSEQHHHLALQNDYVRLFEVEVPPHQSTLLHQHDYDYIYIAIGDAQFTNILPGEAPAALKMADGDIHFSRGGFAHLARNDANTPFRNVTIELLRPQGAVRNQCMRMDTTQPAGLCVGSDDSSTLSEFTTDGTRVFYVFVTPHHDFMLFESNASPANADRVPNPKREHLLVALDDATVTPSAGAQTEKHLGPGDFAWLGPDDSAARIASASDKGARFYLLEFRPKN